MKSWSVGDQIMDIKGVFFLIDSSRLNISAEGGKWKSVGFSRQLYLLWFSHVPLYWCRFK